LKELNNLVILRGGGDLGSGAAHRLFKAGFKVLITEIDKPLVIRRLVSFANAVYSGFTEIESVKARIANSFDEIKQVLDKNEIPVLIDPELAILKKIKPLAVIDATLAKKNIGTNKNMARIALALGPGYCAGVDVDAVIETSRGHNLGRIIYKGFAEKDTGIPGNISGYTTERVLRSPCSGLIKNVFDIGARVNKGDIIAYVEEKPVIADISGVIRGLIMNGTVVAVGQKIGDIDPRGKIEYCNTISDKARTISGGVLEALMFLMLAIRE